MKKFFLDDLDGENTVGYTHPDGTTESVYTCGKVTDEVWLYPDDFKNQSGLNIDYVVNVFLAENGEVLLNVYSLPENWRSLVTYNGGKDGKQSIHDIMELDCIDY